MNDALGNGGLFREHCVLRTRRCLGRLRRLRLSLSLALRRSVHLYLRYGLGCGRSRFPSWVCKYAINMRNWFHGECEKCLLRGKSGRNEESLSWIMIDLVYRGVD